MKSKRGFSVHRQGQVQVAVEVRREGRGRWSVVQLERVRDGEAVPGSLGRALARESASVAWLVPDTEAKSTVATLPPMKGCALKRAAQGLAARSDGGVAESWAVSCHAMGPTHRPGAGNDGLKLQDVFILQAARSFIDEQMAEALRWGLEPGLVLPTDVVLDLLYRRYGPEREDLAAWNLVFIGKEASFLCISTREHLLMTRRLPQDLSNGTDPEEYLGRIATEIERSIFFARQTEASPHVERIIICGDHEAAPRIVERLHQQGLAPSVYWDISSVVVWGDNVPQVDDLLAVAGALVAADGSPHNLGARHRHRPLSPVMRRRSLIGAGAVAVAAVPLLLAGGLMTSRIQAEYLEKSKDRLREVQARATQAEEIYRSQRVLLARENRIALYTAARPDLESILRQLAVLAPPTVVFKTIRLQADETGNPVLHLEGESPAELGADAQGAFVDFLAALRECEFVSLQGEPQRMHIRPDDDEQGGERTHFSLDLQLKPITVAEGI